MLITKYLKRLTIFTLTTLFAQSLLATPVVIAHRGASGFLPEHTLESTTLAFIQGADYIEQDLVLSKDGVLVVLHDIHLDTVTDVENVFPTRARDDGRYYVVDFTLTELRQLRIHERQDTNGLQVFPNRYTGNSHFTIATFEEHIELINELNRQYNRNVGLYPEIKSPAWHASQGVDISKEVVKTLRKYQLDDENKEIYLQCFDFNEIKRLRNVLNVRVKMVQLVAENSWQESNTDYQWLQSEQGIKEVSKYVQGIGPWLPQLYDQNSQQTKPLVKYARKEGLSIHPYTHRVDQLPSNVSNEQLLALLFKTINVEGLFTDFTPQVVSYLKANPKD